MTMPSDKAQDRDLAILMGVADKQREIRTKSAAFSPPQTSPIAQAQASLLALLTASELHEPNAPAAKAYRASMRARAAEAMAAGGIEALAHLLASIRAVDPSKADVREAILDTAWAGLPGWRA